MGFGGNVGGVPCGPNDFVFVRDDLFKDGTTVFHGVFGQVYPEFFDERGGGETFGRRREEGEEGVDGGCLLRHG